VKKCRKQKNRKYGEHEGVIVHNEVISSYSLLVQLPCLCWSRFSDKIPTTWHQPL